jgi:hypothetical protein
VSGGLKKVIGVGVSSDIERINNSLAHIFSVVPEDRPMLRSFGANMKTLVFMPNDSQMAMWAEKLVTEGVTRWELRITVTSVNVDQTRKKEGMLIIEVAYRITDTNVVGNYVFPFYLSYE